MDWGVLVPAVRLDYVHEFDDDSRAILSSFAGDPAGNNVLTLTEDPDRNFFQGGVSATAILPNGLMPFVDYQGLFGHSFLENHLFSAGIRFEF